MNEPVHAADFEPADIGRPWLVAAGVGAVIALAALSMAGLYLFYLPVARDEPVAVSRFAAPRLQVDPQAELRAFEKAQRERLETTRWRDRAAGRLVIPIEAAMAAVAGRGPQAYAPLPAAAQEQSGPDERPPGAIAPADRPANPGAGHMAVPEQRP